MIKLTKTKKIVATVVLTCLVFLTVSFAFFYTAPQTQAVDIFGAIFWPVKVAIDYSTKFGVWIEKNLDKAGAIAYKNALKYFLGRIAEDTATRIATGDKGQTPLFYETGWDKYMFGKDGVLDQAAGQFLYDVVRTEHTGTCERSGKKCNSDDDCATMELTPTYSLKSGYSKLYLEQQDSCILPKNAVNVCEPSTPLAKLRIHYALQDSLKNKAPRCSASNIWDNWTEAAKDPDLLKKFVVSFEPANHDLGIYFELKSRMISSIEQKKETAEKEREGGDGYKPLLSKVSDFIKTPASAIKKLAEVPIEHSGDAEDNYTGQIWADAIGSFTNTLSRKLLNKYVNQGMWDLSMLIKKEDSGGGFLGSVGDILLSQSPISAAREFFAELGRPNYNFDVGVSLEELTMSGLGQFNNAIDHSFSQAVNQEMTLQEAIDAGLISSTASFGFNENGSPLNIDEGIPHRSMLVLRKFRIVPVGWELAAEYYRDFGRISGEGRLNLGKLISKFDNENSPYYGLVDPNWLLKMPPTRCVRQGPSPQTMGAEQGIEPYCIPDEDSTESLGQSGGCEGKLVYPVQRLENYCADYESCLVESKDGNCDANDWGYCIEEESVWRIDGTQCDKNWLASCVSITNLNNNKNKKYLLNTLSELNSGLCDARNSGCREYCADLELGEDEDNWLCVNGDSRDRFYLDEDSEKCSSGSEGCHLFWSSYTSDSLEVSSAFGNKGDDPNAYNLLSESYYKLAPDYYSCDGYTVPVSPQPADEEACMTQGDYWRKDLKLCVASGSDECKRFVKYCKNEDVSCQLYSSVSTSDPDVPAVITAKDCSESLTGDCSNEADLNITWNDECPGSCVGYSSYSRMSTNFESAGFDDLIASTAQVCSNPGCDEFTNLDEVAQGGEGIEYYSYLRQCVKPETGGWETYYTIKIKNRPVK